MKNKKPRWKAFPSPRAVESFLEKATTKPAVIVFDAYDMQKALGAHAQHYLDEVANAVKHSAVVIGEAHRDCAVADLRYNIIRGTYILDGSLLSAVENSEQTFHGRTVRLTDIPDDGDLGVLYIRNDRHSQGYDEDGGPSEEGRWCIEIVYQVGRKNVSTKNFLFDKNTGEAKGEFSTGLTAYFSRKDMDDIISRTKSVTSQDIERVAAYLKTVEAEATAVNGGYVNNYVKEIITAIRVLERTAEALSGSTFGVQND